MDSSIVEQQVKVCTKCNQEKCISEFYRYYHFGSDTNTKYNSMCKSCKSKYSSERYGSSGKHKSGPRAKSIQRRANCPEGMGYCSSCDSYKDRSKFFRDSRYPSGLKHSCKDCWDEKKYAKTASNPMETRRRELKRNYNLEPLDYEKMLNKQGGVCAICKEPPTSKNSYKDGIFAIDHNHNTGKVRGLLCRLCNWGLGNFRDSSENLNSAIAYLNSTE